MRQLLKEGGASHARGKSRIHHEVPKADEVRLFERESDIMSKQQVADLLGVNVKTVSREIQRGKLDCIHVGTRVRITKTALLRYVGESEAGTSGL